MNFGLELNLNVGLEQRLAPMMIQSLKLLQMNAMELELMVKQELEANPMLEPQELTEETESQEEKKEEDQAESESESDSDSEKEVAEEADFSELLAQEKKEEIDWEKYLEDGFDAGSRQTEELESPDERFEKVPVYRGNLQDTLLAQMADRHISSEIVELVEYLIHSLDEGGYLRIGNLSDTAVPDPEEAGCESMQHLLEVLSGKRELAEASIQVREAFHVLRSFEPAGIGARDLRECLLLQIDRLGNLSDLARRIVSDAFPLLEKLKIAAIAKKFEVSPKEVQEALKEVGNLEPRPGRLLNDSMETPIIPDLIVEEIEGELVVLLNDRSVPSLRVSKAYSALLKKGSAASTTEKKFVREKLNSATWLIRAIEQRKSTMLKVMYAIIENQPDFFRKGPTHLRPLILQDIADKIGMHISTVSRVTNGKYVQTTHGIFELKYFFTAGVAQSDGSEVSAVKTKEEIKRLIAAEDSKKPLSDQKIVELLKGKGLDVARRTVAKYRDQMEILPARLRKTY